MARCPYATPKGDDCSLGRDEATENRDHKRVSGLIPKEPVDPGLETTAKGELRSKNFALAKNDKERAYGNP